MNSKPVSELKPGDRITLESGKVVKILKISNGIYRGSKMIDWSWGWSCEDSKTVVEVVDREVEK